MSYRGHNAAAWRRLVRLAIIVLMLVSGPGAPAAGQTGEVVAAQIHLRAGPASAHPSVKILRRGARFEVLERHGDWLKIRSAGQTGFVRDRPHYVSLGGPQGVGPKPGSGHQRVSAATATAADVAAKIRDSQAQVKQTARKEADTLAELATIDGDLNALKGQVDTLQSELVRQEEGIRAAQAQALELEGRIRADQDQALKRLEAYYKMLLVGRVHVLASASGLYDLLYRDMAMRRIIAADQRLLDRLMADQKRQAGLLADLQAAKDERLRLQGQLHAQSGRIAAEKQRRQALLDQIRADKSLQMAALAALQQQAKDLDRRIVALKAEQVAAVPEIQTNSKPFEDLKGLLNLPVSGMMVSSFGAYRNEALNVMNFRSGVDIKTEPGATVRAVGGGKVLFADWFKGYGNMVIVDHGDSYYTVYAHLDALAKTRGAGVAAGEQIGTVGDAGVEGFPKLYFEVRHHGKPQDPAQWLKSR